MFSIEFIKLYIWLAKIHILFSKDEQISLCIKIYNLFPN